MAEAVQQRNTYTKGSASGLIGRTAVHNTTCKHIIVRQLGSSAPCQTIRPGGMVMVKYFRLLPYTLHASAHNEQEIAVDTNRYTNPTGTYFVTYNSVAKQLMIRSEDEIPMFQRDEDNPHTPGARDDPNMGRRGSVEEPPPSNDRATAHH